MTKAPTMLRFASATTPHIRGRRRLARLSFLGKTVAAYFKKINAEGGINGRKIKFISSDDSYDPTKTPEVIRKLVEEDKVLFIGAPFGSAPNAAIQKYLNDKKVPQLFVMSGT